MWWRFGGLRGGRWLGRSGEGRFFTCVLLALLMLALLGALP